MVESRREQVDRRRPQEEEVPESWKTQGPLRTEDLRTTTEGVGQDIETTRDELRD